MNKQIKEKLEALEQDGMEFPIEFLDVIGVLREGAKKYGKNTWIDGKHMNLKDNHASMSRHLAQSFCGERLDDETGHPHVLHLALRALMQHTREKRRIMKSMQESQW